MLAADAGVAAWLHLATALDVATQDAHILIIDVVGFLCAKFADQGSVFGHFGG